MNEAVHIWIQQASAIPGVLGCSVRCTDRSIAANSCNESLPVPWIQSAVREMLDMIQALQEERVATDRLCWSFEKGRIYCTARTDGAMAALLLTTRLEVSPEIEGLLSNFLSVQC